MDEKPRPNPFVLAALAGPAIRMAADIEEQMVKLGKVFATKPQPRDEDDE